MYLILRTMICCLQSTWNSWPICRDAFHIGGMSIVLKISVHTENFERSTDLAIICKTLYGALLSPHSKGYSHHNMKINSTLQEVCISYHFRTWLKSFQFPMYILGWDRDKLYNGFKLPSARKVSNEVISTSKTTADDQISHMVMQFGQFLDHDMDHSMEAISTQNFENGIFCSAT